MARTKLTKNEFILLCKEWFKYDLSSPSSIRWNKEKRTGLYNNVVRANINDIAGTKLNNCWCVTINTYRIRVHKVVLALHGIYAENVVDHIDGNPFNNKLENLRYTSISINSRNRKKSKNNTSGINGVSLVKNKEYWCAFWYTNQKLNRKHFSIKKLGNDLAFNLAVEYRKNKISELNQQGYGYTERHGV